MEWNKALDFFDHLVNQCSRFERKGKSMIYCSANGYMFALLNKAGEIGFRLPKDVASDFMKTYNSGPYYSYGAKMKNYVIIPEALYTDEDLLVSYLNKSYDYVMTLPPK